MLDRRAFSLAAIAAGGGNLGAGGSPASGASSLGANFASGDLEGALGRAQGGRVNVSSETVLVKEGGLKLPHVSGLSILGEGRSLSILRSETHAPVFSQDINGLNYNDGRIEDILFDLSSPAAGSAIELMDASSRMSDWNFCRLHIKGPRGNPNNGAYGFRFGANLTRARFEDCRVDFMDVGAEFSSHAGGQVIFDRLGIYSCHRGLVLANAGNNFIRLLTGDSVRSDFLVLQSRFNVVESVSCEQNGYATGPLLVIDGGNFNVVRRAIFAIPKEEGGVVAVLKNGASSNYLEIFLRKGKVLIDGEAAANEIVAYIMEEDKNSDVIDNGTNNRITKRYTSGLYGAVVREWRNWK